MLPRSGLTATPLAPEREAVVATIAARIRRPGSVVVLVGPPGIGKSTVVDASLVQAQGEDQSLRVLFARGVRSGLSGPWLGLHEMLTGIELVDLGLPQTQTTVLQTALGLVPPGPVAGGASALPGAMLAALNALVEKNPVAVVVDDLDDVDLESAQVIRYLASRRYVSGRGPTFLLTQTHGDEAIPPGAEVLPLPPLSRAGLRVVIRDHAAAPLSAPAVDRLLERSQGNPLRALELARQVEPAATGGLNELLRGRIIGADETARRVLEAVAAMGTATAAQVIAVLGVEPGAVSAAVDAELVAEQNGKFGAAHPAVGDMALSLLGDRDRKSLHARIAEVAETLTDRADHLDRSVGTGPDPALADLLVEAARHAWSMGALLEALDLATRAVQRTRPADPAFAGRQLLVAELAFAYGDYETTVEALSAVSFASLDNEQLDRALPLLSEAAGASRGFAAARAMLKALIVPTTDTVRQAIFDTYLADWDDDAPVATDRAHRAIGILASADKAPISHHRALGVLAVRGVDGGAGLDTGLVERLERLERRFDLPPANVDSLSLRGFYAYQIGDLFTSRSALSSLRAEAIERGDELTGGLCALHLASVEIYAGHRARADTWLAEWEAVNPWPDTPPPAAVAAYGLRALRDGDDEAVGRVVSAPHGPGSELTGELARQSLTGWSAARGGRWESAVTDLSAARRTAESMGIHEPGRRLWIDFPLARSLIGVGEPEEATRIAEELLALSAGRRPLLDGVADRLRGMIAAATDLEAAARHLRTSAKHLRKAGFPGEQALTQFELAMVYSDLRDRPRAVHALDAAVVLAGSAGDRHLSRAFEAARRVIDRTSVDAGLSPRERVVAYAVARGATNREVAAENHLSVRTVESQLSSAYRKLGIRSRTELVALLSAAPEEEDPPASSRNAAT